ncbi:MAG: response regulator transcription factor [Bacteroidales bacterium]|nr:response regulator transcription factor [Bacteroidales bacterium]
MKPRILYVEDDQTLSFVTRDNLERAGFLIDYCDDGNEALEKINQEDYSLYILDVMLPKIDGYTLARRIRQKNESVPIIFLSAKSTKDDKIYGLQLGADDYITKPFSIEELILKIGIFLKRSNIDSAKLPKEQQMTIGEFLFYPDTLEIKRGTTSLSMTHKEAELLLFFYNHLGKIAKRDDILNQVWGNDHFFASRSLDVFVSRLRKLLKADPNVKIENIHNMGYRLVVGN